MQTLQYHPVECERGAPQGTPRSHLTVKTHLAGYSAAPEDKRTQAKSEINKAGGKRNREVNQDEEDAECTQQMSVNVDELAVASPIAGDEGTIDLDSQGEAAGAQPQFSALSKPAAKPAGKYLWLCASCSFPSCSSCEGN